MAAVSRTLPGSFAVGIALEQLLVGEERQDEDLADMWVGELKGT